MLGLFLGSSSRRLLGDYLAIVTLFFGQAFVSSRTPPTRTASRTARTASATSTRSILRLWGHLTVSSTRGYYWFLFGLRVLVLIVLHLVSESRTGRAWKASREDPLAAEMMGMPVNRLKIMAFSFGAAIAGLAGSVFAAAQTGAFPQNFGTQVLILIYAVVILGGAGSLTGMLAGATAIIVSFQVLDSTSPPNNARTLFYLGLIVGVAALFKEVAIEDGGRRRLYRRARLRSARDCRRCLAAGYERIGHIWRLPDRRDQGLGPASDPRKPPGHLRLPRPDRPRGHDRAAQGVVARSRGAPDAVLTAFVWENLLIQQPAVTRYVLFGVLLIALMATRPQGLFGTAKVEIA